MKRLSFLAILSALILGMVIIAPSVQAQQKKVTFLSWNLPFLKDMFMAQFAEFNQRFPDVELEWLDKKGSEWATYYQTLVIGGDPPDVVDIQGALFLEYADQGGLLDLGPYLKRDGLTGRYLPEMLDTLKLRGGTYLVPFYRSKTLLFYNKIMFKEAGLVGPPRTFDQLIEYSQKLAKGEKAGLITLNFDWLYWPFFAVNGVELLTPDGKKAAFNTPAAARVLEKLAAATKSGAIPKISWTGRWVEPNSAFAAGNVGMLHAHSNAFKWFEAKAPWVNSETLGVAHFPGGFSTPNNHGLGISKSSKNPDLAWELIKIITSKKWATALGRKANLVTGNVNADELLMKEFKEKDPILATVLQTQFEHLDKMVATWPNPKDSRVKEAFYPEIQNALFGRKSATKALADAERKVNRVLGR